MKKMAFFVILVVGLVLMPTPAVAQHRYLGEYGAKVYQCLRFYQSTHAKALCVGGRELQAGQIDRLGLVDELTDIDGFGSIDGDILRHTSAPDRSGRAKSMGTRERVITGGGIGATLGAGIGAIFGRGGTGALLGAGTGAIFGAVSGSKASKKANREAEAQEGQYRSESQAREERADAVSGEEKLLRNRFDANVHVIMRSPDGRIEELIVDPGQTLKINPLRGTQLVLAEVECLNGEFDRLEYGSGKINLKYNAGWEFDPRSAPSICP